MKVLWNDTTEDRMRKPMKQETKFEDQSESQILGQLRRMSALHQISLALNSRLNFQATADLLLEKIDSLLHYPITSLRLLNKGSGNLELVACRNLIEEEWREREVRIDKGHAKVLFEQRAPLAVTDVQTDPTIGDPDFVRNQGLRSCLRIPLIARGEILGVLSFYTKEERRFSDEEIELLSALGSQAAVAFYGFRAHLTQGPGQTESETRAEATSIVSHDIRTRLTSLMGYTGMIRDQIFGEINCQQTRALDKIMRNAYELLTITEKLETTRLGDLKEEVLIGSRPLNEAVSAFEREAILKALNATGFNQSKAATLLGITRSILRYKMRKLQINEEPKLKS